MAQFLKEDVQRVIRRAALEAFAEEGFEAATIAHIAKRAGVSTGNVYRYFENKEVLLLDVVPEAFARQVSRLLRRRVEAARGHADPRKVTEWQAVSAELLDLAIENRLAVAFLFDPQKAAGTVHAGFSDALVEDLVALAILHARSRDRRFEPSAADHLVLRRIYCGLVDTIVAVLRAHTAEADIRDAVDRFSTYHLAGLKALLERT